ncbi:MAG: nucleotide exchange factor GrpE, partial [Candidatus Thorarchaeota archaeon]
HIRLQAEFDNYRKRMNARYEEVTRFASEGIILKVLDIVDNLERALEVDFKSDPESAKDGIRGIHNQIEKILANEQVRSIVCVGLEFDPYYQNAIQTVMDESLPDSTVVQEFQKGYMIRDKVLRPAMVSVNRHAAVESQPVVEDEKEENTSDEKKGDY